MKRIGIAAAVLLTTLGCGRSAERLEAAERTWSDAPPIEMEVKREAGHGHEGRAADPGAPRAPAGAPAAAPQMVP